MTIEDEKSLVSARWPKFFVSYSHAQVDKTETKLKENPSTLNYITPHFRAEAEIDIGPLRDGEEYTVGWVQAVTSMKFFNTYPSGQSSWEIQELNERDTIAVSDADGRQYPWYGVTTECMKVRGPCDTRQRLHVLMNDNFSPTVSWAVPVGKDQPDTLKRIHRDQSFIAWLVAKNEANGDILPLRAYQWRAVINIAIDPTRTIGERAKLLEPKLQAQPLELFDIRVPQSALQSPRANEAQKFVWRTSERELVFEVSCRSSTSQTTSETRYSCRYAPY